MKRQFFILRNVIFLVRTGLKVIALGWSESFKKPLNVLLVVYCYQAKLGQVEPSSNLEKNLSRECEIGYLRCKYVSMYNTRNE